MNKQQKIRLLEEAQELNSKLTKLETFIQSDEQFTSLCEKKRHRLELQYIVMRQYFQILTERICDGG